MRVDWAERRWLWLLTAALAATMVLVVWRGPISERLLPDPRMNRQLELAQQALAEGRLSAADGSGARELFESVLAGDPDQMTARQGLVDVRNAAIARTQQALAEHRLVQARNNLALAEALSAPAVQVQALKVRLQDLEDASGDATALLAQASAQGVSDETALAIFNKVLTLDAENEIALKRRHQLFERWLLRAEALLADNQIRAARDIVDRVVADDPAHLDLPPVQALLGEALARVQREQSRVLALARADEQAGRLDSAAKKCLGLVEAGDDSAVVRDMLHRLSAQMALQAQRQAADFQFRRAQASLEKARHWSPDAPEIALAEQKIAQSRLAQKRLADRPGSSNHEPLAQLLLEAEQAMARGEFIAPPGASAWDKLRVASASAPDSPQVLELQRQFASRTRACFERAMTDNRLARAHSCLQASLAVEPYSRAANEAGLRLAERWLARADERIAAGDYAEAEEALRLAGQWQPNHPKLESTAERLSRARAGSR